MKPLEQMHLAVIGVGLIGGSLARVLRAKGKIGRITGVGRQRDNLELAVELGVIDDWTHDIAEAAQQADLICVAVPVGSYRQVFRQIDPVLKHQIIFDVGSTKQSVIDAAMAELSDLSGFVPAHPLAGTEKSGVAASFETLYEQRLCILTPTSQTNADALEVVREIWNIAGSKVLEMDANQHDHFLAGVSHLPHIAAFGLVYAIEQQALKDRSEFDPFAFAAGGFRDFTRIASSSPEMWRDIALNNRSALIDKIDSYQLVLDQMKSLLEKEDGDGLLKIFSEAKQRRDVWLASHEENRS